MLFDRMFRAAMLDPLVFDEIKEDRGALGQAVQVIVITTAASALASGAQALNTLEEADVPNNVLTSAATAVVTWLLWCVMVYLIGTGVFGGAASFMEVLRNLAFAQSPSVLIILSVPLAFVPTAGTAIAGLLGLAVALWTLIVSVIATRQTLGITTGKATVITLITAVVLIVVSLIVTLTFFPETFQLDSA